MVSYAKVLYKVKLIVSRHFDRSITEISRETDLYDFGADSLDAFEIQCELEDEFHVLLEKKIFEESATLGEITTAVLEQIQKGYIDNHE